MDVPSASDGVRVRASADRVAAAIAEYERLTPRSRELWEQASRRVPGGVTSNVRFFPPYPLFMTRGSGSTLIDADGRTYIDYCLAFGPLVAGHGHPHVQAAIRAEMDRAGTVIFGTPSEIESRLAERLSALIPSAEMTRFTNSGTESTMHALRIARGATGRTHIVKFEGHYHGVHDAVLVNIDRPLPKAAASDGIPPVDLDGTIVLPFNDTAAFRETLESDRRIAAVILEPIARGAIQAEPGFLRAVREITQRRDVVLIFDEVVSWPRVGLGGAQRLLGVTPDLTALGKSIGGGLPMGAVVGRRDLMSIVTPPAALTTRQGAGDRPYVFHGGTYNGTPMAAAAGLAVLELLEDHAVFNRWMQAGEHMREELVRLFASEGAEAQVIGAGSMFDFYFTPDAIRSSRDIWASDLERRRAIDYRLLAAGIYNSPLHRFHLSLMHSDADLEKTLAAIQAALRCIRS